MATQDNNIPPPTSQPKKRGRPKKQPDEITIESVEHRAPAIQDLRIKAAQEIIELQTKNETIFKNDLYSFTGSESLQELASIKKNVMEIIINNDKDKIVQFVTSSISAIVDIYTHLSGKEDNTKLEKFKYKLQSNQKRLEPHIMSIVKKYPRLFTLTNGLPIELFFIYELYGLYNSCEEEEINKSDVKKKYNDLF